MRLVGDDRHDARADAGIAQQVAQEPGERGGGARLHLLARAREHVGERVGRAFARGHGNGSGPHHPLGGRAIEGAAPRHHVLVLGRVDTRMPERRVAVAQRRIGDVELKPIPETASSTGVSFLIWWVALRDSMLLGRASTP